jgi:hypothetical protein
VLDRIGPTALPRSSIIISDEPLSKETNYRTEFVAVLNDHPQGGFITRKPTPREDLRVATRDDSFFPFFQRNWWEPEPPPNPRQRSRQDNRVQQNDRWRRDDQWRRDEPRQQRWW